jgi:hypothetical protein
VPCFLLGFRPGFRPFVAIFTATSAPFANTCGIERTTDDVVTNTRKVLDPTAANQYNRVFLKFMTFTRDICGNFHLIG